SQTEGSLGTDAFWTPEVETCLAVRAGTGSHLSSASHAQRIACPVSPLAAAARRHCDLRFASPLRPHARPRNCALDLTLTDGLDLHQAFVDIFCAGDIVR